MIEAAASRHRTPFGDLYATLGEGFGSCSEVDRFRVEAGYRAFVERFPAREPLHLG